MFKNMVCGKSRMNMSGLKTSLISRIAVLGLLFSFCCFCTIAAGQTSYIIVHCHNPEGKEINSISYAGTSSAKIYDGDTLIGYGAYSIGTHNRVITISAGVHTIKVKYNNISMEQNINLNSGETQILTFTFARTLWDGGGLCRTYHSKIVGSFDGITSDIYAKDVCNGFPYVYTEVRFGNSHWNIAGTYFAEATMIISYSPGNFSISSSCYAHIDYTRGGPDWFTYYPYQWTWAYSLAQMLLPQFIENYLIQRTDNFVITTDFNYYHYFEYDGSVSFPVIFLTVPYDLDGTAVGSDEVNQPPVASFKLLKVDGDILEKPMVGGNIIFDANKSSDPDGNIVSYQWDFDDGPSENLTVPVVPHVFETPDVYTVTLTVTDNDGLTDSNSVELDLTLKNGDLLLCRSYKSLIPNVDFWTHIGIYVEQSNQIVEALEGGVVATPLAEWSWLGENGRNETCVRALRVKTDDSTRDRAVNFALSEVNRPYDLVSILLNKKQEGGECSLCKKWYCSELVWAAYLSASNGQINLDQDEKGLVSPDDVNKDNDVEMIGEHKEEIPQRVYWNIVWGEAHSPVDLEITDPHGFTLTKQLSEILGATYDEVDVDADGDTDDLFAIPDPQVGQYLIKVIPEPDALPTDTYSLEVVINGQRMVLAQDVQIQNIPSEPYIIESKLNPADFDNDGDVDAVDLDTFVLHWLAEDCNYPSWCEGTDLDYSGRVNFVDFTIFAGNWLWEKIPADIDIDGDVDFVDYAVFANNWMDNTCCDPNWCEGTDFDHSGSVDMLDLATFARYWLEGI